MPEKISVALCQMAISRVFTENVANALAQIEQAAHDGAKIVVLPEIFVCPYEVDRMAAVAIDDSHDLIGAFTAISKKHSLLLVAGSVVEQEGTQLYNSSYIFDKGNYLAKHRKLHLFDINLPDMTFRESETFSPGDKCTIVDTQFGRVGVAICFDLRFPEIFKYMALKGVTLIIAPAAFNTVTGPLHWELVLRSRALDSQCYLLACSPALNTSYAYKAYGHSAVIDPMGEIVSMLDSSPGVLRSHINMALVEQTRQRLPLLKATKWFHLKDNVGY